MCRCVLEAIGTGLPFQKQLFLLCCHFRISYYEVEIQPLVNHCAAASSLLSFECPDLAEN